jgi:hypothetical protein
VGRRPQTDTRGAALLVGSVRGDGSDATVLAPPPAEERAKSNDFSDQGQFAEIRMAADEIEPLDVSVLPGAAHVAVLMRGRYLGTEVFDPFFGSLIPALDLDAYEYVLIDAATAAPVQRFRTRCALAWARGSFLDDFECAVAPGQDEAERPGFVPRDLQVLYGAR